MFYLVNHPNAKLCYAWSYPKVPPGNVSERFVAVLGIPPVVDPASAVRASIVAESKGKK